jgi:hypothetical protein
MNKYKIKPIIIFGKTINTIIIGAVIMNLGKENVVNAQVPYRLVNESEGAANSTQPIPTTPIVIDAKELPTQMSADNLLPIIITKINATSAVQIELEEA